jgi:FkbM family methyltransferase
MSVTCYYSGRLGNIVFHIGQLLAHAKKYNLPYYLPTEAIAYKGFRDGDVSVPPLNIASTGENPINPKEYDEPFYSSGNPAYHEIPFMDNVVFRGYYQSFKYFDWCRDYILETFNLPHSMEKGVVSISVRRGDCVGSTAFVPAPPQYYHKAVEYMLLRGYNLFRVYSDDQEWCKGEFTTENYPGATFLFSEGDEMSDYIGISNCEHNITARSTFSLTAAWMNQNPNKIVLVPQKDTWWRGQNLDLIPDYFTQINFEEMQYDNMDEYELLYDDFSFKLTIPDYWVKIYRGQKIEPLYHDYCVMMEVVKSVSKSKYIMDVGANHGLFSVPASKLGYKVVGFEPVSQNIFSLEKARQNNNLANFDMFHLALSDKNGEIDIYVPECPDNSSLSQSAAVSNMRGKEFNVEKVATARFDDWILEHPNFFDIGLIKLDVQGAEYIILEGMRDYLRACNDIYIICEYEHHLNSMGRTFDELDNLIMSHGFSYVKQISPNDKLFYKP